jgi:hypothetical protein
MTHVLHGAGVLEAARRHATSCRLCADAVSLAPGLALTLEVYTPRLCLLQIEGATIAHRTHAGIIIS